MKIIRTSIVALNVALGALTVKAQQKTVTLDYYFNHEFHKAKDGNVVQFHYTWEDNASSGYSIWGQDFVTHGARLKSLSEAPDTKNLTGTDIYIIVDPDTKKETENPHFIEQKDIDAIAEWVKNGGVLVMMANDSANVELPHFNKLAERFGMHFNDDLYKHVIGNEFEMGTINVPADNPIFKTARKIYLKDIATIQTSKPAKAVLTDNGKVIVALAKYGKGAVFAVGDPWFYNEYTNGRLPARFGFENDKAADDAAQWLLQQAQINVHKL